MSDSDIMWDVYREDIKDWSTDRLIQEIQLVRKDFDGGDLDVLGYETAKRILEEQLSGKLDQQSTDNAYDRSMKGI